MITCNCTGQCREGGVCPSQPKGFADPDYQREWRLKGYTGDFGNAGVDSQLEEQRRKQAEDDSLGKWVRPTTKPVSDTYDETCMAFDEVQSEGWDIFRERHAKYGPSNIASTPGGPLTGLLVRMHDKLGRLENLLATGEESEDESLTDTLIDLGNYALIGVLVARGLWPGTEKQK